MRAARHLQDVHGFLAARGGDYGNAGVKVARREDDVRVAHVGVERYQHGRMGQLKIPVDRSRVVLARHGIVAAVHHVEGGLAVRAEQNVWRAEILQVVGHVEGYGAGVDEYDVPLRPFRQGARRAPLFLRLKPGGVEEFDEHERQYDEKEKYAAHEHDDGEDAPHVRAEGDVPEAQGGHDGERPVDPRRP